VAQQGRSGGAGSGVRLLKEAKGAVAIVAALLFGETFEVIGKW
jgi:hypothetical protein